VSFEFRPVSVDEIPQYVRAQSIGFGENEQWYERSKPWVDFSLDRTMAAFEDDAVVATGRNYQFELTLPGGSMVPAGGVSAITTRPTHRRRGLLRTMMTRLFEDSVEHGESVSMLTASEATIYERFGYGVSTRAASVVMDRRDIEFVRPRPSGRFRLVDVDEADKVEPDVYDRMRRIYPGALSRPAEWWTQQFELGMGNRFDVLFESPDGTIDGYATYGIRERWGHGGPEASLHARDVIATTPTAEHALWRYLSEVDLVRTVSHRSIPLDTPLPWLLSSIRAARFEMVHDYVWTRLLDIPSALGARTYAAPGKLVLEVRDGFRPGGPADGRFTVEGAPDGATVAPAPGATPDLTCDVATVSAAWLGGVRWSELAAAGLIDEHTPGALSLADAMFASTPLPYPFTGF